MAIDLYNLVLTAKIQKGGGGGDIEVDALTATENGTYSASSGHAYDPVTVSVPTGVFPSGTSSITANGIYDVTNFASASVNVPGIVPSGTSSITSNGIYDITNFSSVDVNVPASGGITGDEIAERTISGVVSGSASFISASAFQYCKNITGAIFPNVKSIETYAFFYCTSLATISFPSATSIGTNAFNSCSSLTGAIFPNAKSIGSSAFYYCTSLATISFPSATSIGNSAFYYCTSLTTASFPSATSIGSQAFRNCSKLMSLYLLGSSMASLGNSGFTSTPMTSSTYTGSFGSIYVPASLVDSYKTATNWSAYSARITSYVE